MSAERFATHFASVPQIAKRAAEITFTEADCWEWPSARYGMVHLQADGKGRSLVRGYVHRISLEIKLGRDIAGKDACHTCDNPPCCNPAHLFAGTRLDNVRDCIAKGRAAAPPRILGVDNPKAVASDRVVREAVQRSRAGETHRSIATDLGVSVAAVASWATGRTRQGALEVSDDTEGRNGGKPCRVMRWIGGAS